MIAPSIERNFPGLNDAQRSIIGHLDGPLLVIAGPGSGKTFSMVLRALNLLLLGKAQPKELVLCTFTEKAAFEMRDRMMEYARKVEYKADLSELRISTIHGLCNQILTANRHRTHLGNSYDTLDELTQLLFIFEHFKEIIGEEVNGKYVGRWSTKWTAIEGIRGYFDKITEELIGSEQLVSSTDTFLQQLGAAYQAYEAALNASNRIDFAHLQSLVHGLLSDPDNGLAMTREFRYVMVDEYQDTNYVQEQILLLLTREGHNLCVVGDEDQSLYRFRGATVRNILEFKDHFPGCRTVLLNTNYRSHKSIVQRYDRWMTSADWTGKGGTSYRYPKTIVADPETEYPEYPAVLSIWGQSEQDEAERFADMVEFLKRNAVIGDYSQVALLLHSVRDDHSGRYLRALEKKGIPWFCPRARTYFDNPEVKYVMACYALIFGWHGEGRGEVTGALAGLASYVDQAMIDLATSHGHVSSLTAALQGWVSDMANLREGESLDLRPADLLYHLFAHEPFRTALGNENSARNLAMFSQLLNVFQSYYHYSVVTFKNREFLRYHLFGSFLRLLHDGGINEYEDPDQPFPIGHVQVMTIHQSKGLEFPVVVVGSLNKQLSSAKKIDTDLGAYYARVAFEPMKRITDFDRMRLHYVAFSRPQKVLVLTSPEAPKDHFAPIWQGLPQWPHVQQELLAAQRFNPKPRVPVKRTYSFTGDLRIYETCPRQYQFFREYDFTPSRSAVIFFGLLVHQTIEEIHRIALDGEQHRLTKELVDELFERTYGFLCLSDVKPIVGEAKESARRQVHNYFRENRSELSRVIQTEVDVSLEKDGYILAGKVDLLLGSDGRLELLDFKTSPRPVDSPELINAYERQLCTYAHILEQRHGKHVDRLLLYWTAETTRAKALMELPYDPTKVVEAGRYFDEVVSRIQAEEFAVKKVPEAGICKECDLKHLCRAEGIIDPIKRRA